MTVLSITLSCCAALLGFVFILCLFRLKKTFDRLEQMLDSALDGTFEERAFDESRLSALETKLCHYLSACRINSRQTARERDQVQTLIGDISHQTKTPVANLRLYAELLTEQDDLPETCKPLALEISQQSAKLDFLIQSLIKSSRLENGIVQVAPVKSDICPLLTSVSQELKHTAADKSITLTAAFPQSLPACFDPKWTAEALHNILDNAVKYTPTGGHVTLSARAYELFCRVDITDTGMGITEDEIPKIFGRFYRSPAVSQEPGVGIGLYLAREIITLQGGYIKVQSTPGCGSCFSVFLPCYLKTESY